MRSLVKETAFWNAFGLWFAFEPALARTDAGWARFGEDAEAYVFCAKRRPESLAWSIPENDVALLAGQGARGTSTNKSDDTFELLLLMDLE